jgi:hypothetical protein
VTSACIEHGSTQSSLCPTAQTAHSQTCLYLVCQRPCQVSTQCMHMHPAYLAHSLVQVLYDLVCRGAIDCACTKGFAGLACCPNRLIKQQVLSIPEPMVLRTKTSMLLSPARYACSQEHQELCTGALAVLDC